jgi:elongation factor 1-delta
LAATAAVTPDALEVKGGRKGGKKAKGRQSVSPMPPTTCPSSTNKNCPSPAATTTSSSVVNDIKKVREEINQALSGSRVAALNVGGGSGADDGKVKALEAENKKLKTQVDELVSRLSKLETRVNTLEGGKSAPAKAAAPAKKQDDDDDDIDLFGSDEDEEADAAREERLKAYAEKKAKKPGPIAKSSILLDVKPWDDETDMKKLEAAVRAIEMDGLMWGASKLMPVAYNVKKLQIVVVIQDDLVSVDELQEKIEANEDFVQSVDIAAFNKI